MGDVMLLVPALASLTAAYPEVEITVVTRPRFSTFFKRIPGVKVFEADVDNAYSGVLGMRDLFKALSRKVDYDIVIDLHDHLRTMILRSFFKLFGKKVSVFDKGRAEKRAFTRKENKVVQALPHTVDRYVEAFRNAGFEFPIIQSPYLTPDAEAIAEVNEWLTGQGLSKNERWLGIAPFAMHKTKVWPVENYVPLLEAIKQEQVHVFFFGGGAAEIEFFDELVARFPSLCTRVAGHLRIRQEIALLQHIDLMLCADSSNMHLAALTATPLLSIWGGTLPDVGFGPYKCGADSILQVDREALPCRPCSVYGKETCHRGDFACLTQIEVKQVASEIVGRLRASE